VAKLFDYNKVYLVRFDPRKDANDFLQLGLETELRNLWWASKKYKPENIICSFSDFEKILKAPQPTGVPYPFPSWNEMLYGMRRGESVLITAPEGVGKTQVMHAIEYQLLKETDDAIGSIFLEEPKKRHLQAIAGLELGLPVHLPDCGVSDDDVLAAVKKASGQDERLHIYNHFGSDDPRVLEDTIRFLVCSCGVVFILLDHIGMVVSGLGGEDERLALDYLDTRLTMMTQELNFGLIKVSHVNDFGETRGSRLIGKNANIRIDLTREVKNDDPIIKNTTHVMVSKNRFSHKTGLANPLFYDTSSYRYSEITTNG
jgi:replicative DNA helicase